MRRRLIGFILLVLLGVLEPFSLKGQDLQPPPPAGLQTAIFAGGCFWCMVHPFAVIDMQLEDLTRVMLSTWNEQRHRLLWR